MDHLLFISWSILLYNVIFIIEFLFNVKYKKKKLWRHTKSKREIVCWVRIQEFLVT